MRKSRRSIDKIVDPAQRIEAATQNWGKGGAALLSMIGELPELTAKARNLGLNITPEQVRLADALGDAWDDMTTAMQAAAFQIGAAVAPAFKLIAEWGTGVIKVVTGIAHDFPAVTQVLAIGGAVFAALGAALGTVAVAAVGLGAVLAPAAAAISAIGTAAAAIFSPVGLIVAAALALGAALLAGEIYFLGFTKAGRSLVNTVLQPLYAVLERFKALGDVFKRTFASLGEAIKAGDMKLAWDILLVGMSESWHTFMATIFKGLEDMADYIRRFAIVLGPGALALGPVKTLLEANKLQQQRLALNARRTAAALAQRAKAEGARTNLGKRPGEPGYGGQQSAAVIGFSSRAALMARNVGSVY